MTRKDWRGLLLYNPAHFKCSIISPILPELTPCSRTRAGHSVEYEMTWKNPKREVGFTLLLSAVGRDTAIKLNHNVATWFHILSSQLIGSDWELLDASEDILDFHVIMRFPDRKLSSILYSSQMTLLYFVISWQGSSWDDQPFSYKGLSTVIILHVSMINPIITPWPPPIRPLAIA